MVQDSQQWEVLLWQLWIWGYKTKGNFLTRWITTGCSRMAMYCSAGELLHEWETLKIPVVYTLRQSYDGHRLVLWLACSSSIRRVPHLIWPLPLISKIRNNCLLMMRIEPILKYCVCKKYLKHCQCLVWLLHYRISYLLSPKFLHTNTYDLSSVEIFGHLLPDTFSSATFPASIADTCYSLPQCFSWYWNI
jgi:hypothetical protein